jgi:hypothetical protein
VLTAVTYYMIRSMIDILMELLQILTSWMDEIDGQRFCNENEAKKHKNEKFLMTAEMEPVKNDLVV